MLIPPTVTSALAKPSLPFGAEAPVGEPALGRVELVVGEVGELAPQADLLRPAPRPAGRAAARRARCGNASAAAPASPRPPSPRPRSGRKSIADLLAVPPVGRDLQDRRAGKAAMGEQGGLAERRLAGARDDVGRDARQRRGTAASSPLSVSGTRAGRGSTTLSPKLPREVVGEAGRAHLGDRRAAGGDHQRRRRGGLVADSGP